MATKQNGARNPRATERCGKAACAAGAGDGGEGLRVPEQAARRLTLQRGWGMPEVLCWGWPQDQHAQLTPQAVARL